MEIALIHAITSLLNTLTLAITAICIARIKARTRVSAHVSPQNQAAVIDAAALNTIAATQSSSARNRRFGLSVLLALWGQLNIVVAGFLPVEGALSPQAASFIAQGTVFLLLGLWLMLRD